MNSIQYGSISTGSKEASISAEKILKKGGNAFDAAIGAVFVSMTSEFALTGPFGGGTCVGLEKGKSPFVYDFFVDCPKNINPNKEFKGTHVNFGNTIQKFHIGRGSIAIPGNIVGLLEIHKNHGQLPLKNILKYAIDFAKSGVIISSYQAYILKLIKPILTFSHNNLFYKNNSFIKSGDKFINSKFSDFLEIILEKGSDYFYNGEGLDKIINYLDNVSCLAKEDFINYKVHKRKPLSLEFNKHIIHTNPAPSYGGTLIVFLLKLLKTINKDINTLDLIKSMNLTSKARNDACVNPHEINEISKVLLKENFEKYKKLFYLDNFDFCDDLDGFGSTTHVSIIDKNGNAASITTTNGEGCGSIIPEYGIMMNNMLGEVDLNPFGFHKWGVKRRLPTMISPIIITQDSTPKFVLGSGGSNRIRSANIQVILNLLTKNLNLKNSIEAPRLHLEGNTLFYEPGIIIPKIKNLKLTSFDNKNLFFGGVNGVSITEAVGDQRRGGYGIII